MELLEIPEGDANSGHVSISLPSTVISSVKSKLAMVHTQYLLSLSVHKSKDGYYLPHSTTIKKVISLVHNNEIFQWLEGREVVDSIRARNLSYKPIDSITKARNFSLLDHFLSESARVHPMWKTILEGKVEALFSWIRESRVYSSDIDETDCNGLNALHYSIMFKQVKLVELLLDSGAAHDCLTATSDLLPLQLAIMGPSPFVEAIDLLCSYKDAVNYCLEGSKWGTALDLAVKEGSLEGVVILLRYGANPNQCWNENTSLERAIQARNKTMVKAMLEIPSQSRGLDKDILLHVKSCTSGNTRPCHGHTPFAELISELPDMAEIVLNHCIQTTNAPHEENYEITFDCSLFENENSSANKCHRALPCTCLFEVLSWFKSDNIPDDMAAHDRHLNCFNEKAYDSFEKYHHPLYNVMLSKDTRLLKHPVVQSLLEQKLKKFGWLLYYINLLMYLLLVCLLMTFILLLPNPASPACLELANISVGNISIEKCAMLVSDNRSILLLAIKSITLTLVLTRCMMELYQMYSQKVFGYFTSWVNWVELAQCISVAVFLFDVSGSRCFCPTRREWEAGIVSLSMTWLVLFVWLQTMHWIGIYVTIMLKIIYSFVKVAVFGLLLIVAFGLSFYMLFYRPPKEDATFETFGSPIRAMLAVIPLTAGDISMESIFYSSESEDTPIGREYQTLAFIIWLSAVIIMSVLFNNMLVGLAVGEVTSVIEKARITTIKQRIDLVLTLEEHLPECIHQQVIQKEPITVRPNTIPSACYCIRVVVQFLCVCCSAVFFNTNHFRYWTFIFNPRARKADKKFEEITRIVEKARFNSSEEDEDVKPVTKEEVRVLLDELKEEIKYYDCVMQSLSF